MLAEHKVALSFCSSASVLLAEAAYQVQQKLCAAINFQSAALHELRCMLHAWQGAD